MKLQLLLIKRLLWYSIYARDFPAQQVWIRANVLVEIDIGPEIGQTATCHQGVSQFHIYVGITMIEACLNLDPEVVSTFLNLLVFLVGSSVVADVINLCSYCPGCGRCVKPGHSSSNRTPEYEPRSFSAVCVGTHSASLSAINCICTMCSTMEAELELACQPLGFSVCTGCKSCTWGQFA